MMWTVDLPEEMASEVAEILRLANIGCEVREEVTVFPPRVAEMFGVAKQEKTLFNCTRKDASVLLEGSVVKVTGHVEKVFMINWRSAPGRGMRQNMRDGRLLRDIEKILNQARDDRAPNCFPWRKTR
jgi:hypothetical protein